MRCHSECTFFNQVWALLFVCADKLVKIFLNKECLRRLLQNVDALLNGHCGLVCDEEVSGLPGDEQDQHSMYHGLLAALWSKSHAAGAHFIVMLHASASKHVTSIPAVHPGLHLSTRASFYSRSLL